MILYCQKGDNAMNNRIRTIRELNHMNQETFGKHLRIKKSSVSRLESGDNNPSDQTIDLICKEFGINEKWLRTGEGDMYYTPDDRYAINVAKLQRTDDETIIRWVNAIAETSPDALREIEGFMKRLLGLDE